MKIISWNLNSIRARLDHLLDYLDAERPDVACLQELKCQEHQFPYEEVGELGYEAVVHGQAAYNGVALLSRSPIRDPRYGAGPQARLIAGTIEGLRVISVYVPNGQTVGSDKWTYKLSFFDQLMSELAAQPRGPLLLCGDFNVAPKEIDAAQPEKWAKSVLCHADARAKLERLFDAGYADTLRLERAEGDLYSWWDYRQGRFQRNEGLRIDLILSNPEATPLIQDAFIHTTPRGWQRPSDHAPVGVVINLSNSDE